MIFNDTGRHLKEQFNIEGKHLESVNTFCYLGFEVKPSGTVKHAMVNLYEKAKKALRPILCASQKFNLPVHIVTKLFHTYVSPIILYNVENWGTLTDSKLKQFNITDIYDEINSSKTDVIHRKLLKNILGVSRSCPNMAVYGEIGETPLSLKGYRLMLNYWNRLSNLPNESLLKKALLENTNLRTKWIQTIEKLIKTFNLIETSKNSIIFKKNTKIRIREYYTNTWKERISDENASSRLKVYKALNSTFSTASHLSLPFYLRKAISKIRCSDHNLQIERGRHLGTERDKRICYNCQLNEVEDEEHFLLKCTTYQDLRKKYHMTANNINDFLNTENQENLAKFLLAAFELREKP